MPTTGTSQTAGAVSGLHATRVGKTSFAVAWDAGYAPGGYRWTVRNLGLHETVRRGVTKGHSASVFGLAAGSEYNFGIQGLPGGEGANIHVTTDQRAVQQQAQGGSKPPSGTSVPRVLGGGTYRAFAAGLMLAHGWGLGQNWMAFQRIEAQEAGWNPNARNPSSGAYGMAQALGHGTAHTAAADGENNYGDYGTPDAVCRAANSGNGYAQLVWMCNYIARTYGSPSRAWAQYWHGSTGSY